MDLIVIMYIIMISPYFVDYKSCNYHTYIYNYLNYDFDSPAATKLLQIISGLPFR